MKTRLKTAREQSGKTQAQVAREAGINERLYQRYEYGQNEPGVRTAIRIADALGISDVRRLFAAAADEGYTHQHFSMEKTLPQGKANEKGE